ncbi:MAG: N-acetylmuramoyl-L-alanine amidase [Bacteroidota bacterium]
MNRNRLVFAIISGFIFFLLLSFIKNDTEPEIKDKFIVVLDAGHGGHDPGNLGNGYLEKNIALAIVLKAGKILEKQSDVKVIYTREDDTFVNLYVRGEVANKANADLFVSVHCDSHNTNAYGAGTFVMGLHTNKQNFEVAKKENSVIYLEDNYEQQYSEYDINSPESAIGLTIMQEEFLDQSISLAKLLQDSFTKKLKRKDRKVKQAGFIVLHQTFMPSVLVEAGFLTNKEEGAYLNSEKGQNEMASAIANAILDYKSGVDANLIGVETIEDNPLEKAEKEIVEQTKVEPKTTPKTETKKVAQKEPPQKEVASEKSTESPANIIFKVQLLASSKVIPLQSENFKGLRGLSSEPYKNMYRYLFGETDSYKVARQLKSEANTKGYTTSYIVAYRNGKRIDLQEALNSSSTQ